jgi:hypothetical protein
VLLAYNSVPLPEAGGEDDVFDEERKRALKRWIG